ncbi:ABC transporter permease [Microbacterium sp. zg.Y1090]|uniref:ABC transporter permease n=1 Tax=Microbacterium TaxID=33882 RepID=UPI00214CCD02|nr:MULTISPECIES: ABC transporter permease [unclassified Microbacterium]MCR2812267.1 ABC transporter permease [Microbacterium sp. zg.Y1084]MCR2819951.1 ABC transporter permease [Microbacterium sp. zg.Y1090]MDL5488183.1 ABC transporter permease [Microbacterium sp. zg-Y1211]WIM29317.1 ABC transporter permease [Microbacterium sp. zg-Y1090]
MTTTILPTPDAPPIAPTVRRRTRRSINLAVGGILFGLIAVIGLVSVFWTPFAYDDTGGGRLQPPSAEHWAGTDRLGRDLFTQLMIGARLALAVGFGSVIIAALLGIALGLAAAAARRWVDDAISSLLDIAIAFPTLLLAMLIVAWRGASLDSAILAIGLAGAAVIARLTRITATRVMAMDFVTAARTSGTGTLGILRLHVLRNVWPTLIVPLALQFGGAVGAEASLSYLGLGSPPPNASWGRMLQEAQSTVLVAPTAAILPGILLVALIIGVNLLADGLRDIADPTSRSIR